DGLQAETYLSRILMSRSHLIRDRELEFNCIFMGRVDVFFGSLETEEYPSKNGIRSRLLLGGMFLYPLRFASTFVRGSRYQPPPPLVHVRACSPVVLKV
ncbi:hypothetical protein L195_g000405, partial [Trifolium pratense]